MIFLFINAGYVAVQLAKALGAQTVVAAATGAATMVNASTPTTAKRPRQTAACWFAARSCAGKLSRRGLSRCGLTGVGPEPGRQHRSRLQAALRTRHGGRQLRRLCLRQPRRCYPSATLTLARGAPQFTTQGSPHLVGRFEPTDGQCGTHVHAKPTRLKRQCMRALTGPLHNVRPTVAIVSFALTALDHCKQQLFGRIVLQARRGPSSWRCGGSSQAVALLLIYCVVCCGDRLSPHLPSLSLPLSSLLASLSFPHPALLSSLPACVACPISSSSVPLAPIPSASHSSSCNGQGINTGCSVD